MTNQNSKLIKCQNCHKEFVIEPDDFDFYNKIKVPPPTWCPECRLVRRMTWRNERTLYKRRCDVPEHSEDIISIYSSDKPFKIYDNESWYSDIWDPLDYSKDYDFSKPFFEQFKELFISIPFPARLAFANKNCDYANYLAHSKNCYLSTSVVNSENIFYSSWVDKSNDIFDCFYVKDSERLYECYNVRQCYKSLFLVNCRNCIDSAFLFDCAGCNNCFMSSNLRNKKYYIFNKAYSKDEYFKKLKNILTSSDINIRDLKEKLEELKLKSVHKFALLHNTINVTGDDVYNSKNCKDVFYSYDSETSKYIIRGGKTKDSMDNVGSLLTELTYECMAPALYCHSLRFVVTSSENNNSNYDYCMYCGSSSHLFGCVGLRHKQYCILNKQYTKEEYEKLMPKIIEHMNEMPYIDKKGRVYKYGEFFPPELSPFCYNETTAQEFFPLTKEQALKQDYSWKDPEERDYKIDIKSEDLPDHIKDVKDDIIGKVIQCAHAKLTTYNLQLTTSCNEQCTTAFKIIEPELQFYRRMNLPLPRLCPNCRHYQRIKQRNPLKLWKRKCMCAGKQSEKSQAGIIYQNTIEHFHGKEPCPNEFETTYSPEREEIVYCEKCYLSEVI